MASALSELLRTQSTLFMQSDTQLANSSYCNSMPLRTKLKLFINCPRRRPASKTEIRASLRVQTADDLFDETHRRFVKLVEATPGLRQVAAKKLQELAEDLVKGNKEPSMRIDSDPFEKIRHGFLTFKQQQFLKKPDHFTKLAVEQSPKFLVIACSDSRVCPSNILGFQPGEAFVVRSISNLVPKWKENDISGTSAALEFSVLSLKVEHILVIGHSRCGGIRALMSIPDDGTISSEFIERWVTTANGARLRTKAVAGHLTLDEQCSFCEKESVNQSLSNLLTFPWIKELVAQDKLSVHGGYYDFVEGYFERWTIDCKAGKVENFNHKIINHCLWC